MNTSSNDTVKGFKRLEASALVFAASSVVQLAAEAATIILFPDAVRDIYLDPLGPLTTGRHLNIVKTRFLISFAGQTADVFASAVLLIPGLRALKNAGAALYAAYVMALVGVFGLVVGLYGSALMLASLDFRSIQGFAFGALILWAGALISLVYYAGVLTSCFALGPSLNDERLAAAGILIVLSLILALAQALPVPGSELVHLAEAWVFRETLAMGSLAFQTSAWILFAIAAARAARRLKAGHNG